MKIGQAKHEITCFATSSCTGGFAKDQKDRFINETLKSTLDELQQKTELRLAKIDGLETCPRCDYAEIYPSVDIQDEFRCQKCQHISCRQCKNGAHRFQEQCEEISRRQAESANGQHRNDEVQSAAVIRRCMNCKFTTTHIFMPRHTLTQVRLYPLRQEWWLRPHDVSEVWPSTMLQMRRAMGTSTSLRNLTAALASTGHSVPDEPPRHTIRDGYSLDST